MDKNIELVDGAYRLCAVNELEEKQAIELEIDGRNLFAIQYDGQLRAYWNNCPHLGVALNWMPEKFLDLDGSLIQCSSHGALFYIDSGECIAGPCVGDRLDPVELVEKDGAWFVKPDQPLPPKLVNLREQALRDLD